MEMDKLTALAAPLGHSLTDAPQGYPWENPAQFSNPDDAVDFVIDKLRDKQAHEEIMKALLAGITVEEVVAQIAFKGFLAGAYTPDVAELIKPAVAIYLMDAAEKEGFEPQLFVEDEQEQFNDQSFFAILKERNPKMFDAMNEEINERQRLKVDEAVQGELKEDNLKQNSFLRAEE